MSRYNIGLKLNLFNVPAPDYQLQSQWVIH